MAVPPAPAGLPVAFGVDGLTVELRARDLLVGPAGGALAAAGLLLAVALVMTALGPISGLPLALLFLVLPAAWVGAGWLVIALLELALSAPRRTRIRCDHERIVVEVRVHGMLREIEVVPLSRVAGCRVGADGLELLRFGEPPLVIPADRHPLGDQAWVAEVIEDAVRHRMGFEEEVRGPAQVADRLALSRMVQERAMRDQPVSGKRN